MANNFWEALNTIITLDLNLRGVITELDEALKKIKGKDYLKELCEKFSRVLDSGSEVLIFTGFPVPPLYKFETDGPLGAIALARALIHLNVKPLIIVERELIGVMVKLALALKLRVKVGKTLHRGVGIRAFPIDESKAKEEALRLFSRFHPSAVVFIEKPGRSANGKYYTMRLEDISDYVSKVDQVIPIASKLGILTIGIGDGGNEVGMGILHGISPKVNVVTRTDELLVSTVSNWGAYALIAGLSIIRNDIEILHRSDYEEKLIREAVSVGLIDGILKRKSFSVDSCTLQLNKHIVGLIRSYTINHIRC